MEGLSTLLTDIGSVVSSAAGWASSVATSVTSTPIYLVFTAVPLVGLGIGLFKRIVR